MVKKNSFIFSFEWSVMKLVRGECRLSLVECHEHPFQGEYHASIGRGSPRATIRITLVRSSGRASAPGLTPLRLPRAPKCDKCHKSATSGSTGLFSDVPQISTFRSYVSLLFGSDKSRILILATLTF